MKDKILKLRAEGKKYREICEILDIGMEKVEWYCNPNRKEVSRKGNETYRKKNPIYKKVASFHGITKNKIKSFRYREFLKKCGENPICYITKKPIDITDIDSYSIDHIVPNSKGGNNSLDNAALIRSDINKMKWDKSLDEFFALCEEVLKSNGYKVEKII